MDFSSSPKVEDLTKRVREFMESAVYPAEVHLNRREEKPTVEEPHPRYLRELRAKAKPRAHASFSRWAGRSSQDGDCSA